MGLVRALVALCLVVGGVHGAVSVSAAPGSSASGLPDATASIAGGEGGATAVGPPVSRTVTYDRMPNRTGDVRATVTLRVDERVDALYQYFPENATVEAVNGFERDRDGDGESHLEWDGRTDRPSVVFRLENRTSAIDRGRRVPEVVDAGEWAYLERSVLQTLYYVSEHRSWYSSRTNASKFDLHDRVTGEGVVRGSMVFLGEHSVRSRSATGERVVLIVPKVAEPRVSPERGLQTITNASTRLDIGGRGGTVALLILPTAGVPDHRWSLSGLRMGENSAFVLDDTTAMTWLHEYVHTRQEFDTTPRLRWIVEGSADYYAHLESVREGNLDLRSVPWWSDDLRQEQNGTVLSDPETWEGFTDYAAGPIALAALESRIRNESANASLAAVFRRMNQRKGNVSEADFRRIVADAAGGSQRQWLDRYVDGTEIPDPPRDPFLYTDGPRSDADGDGLAVERERRLQTHPFRSDTDDDRLRDGAEVERYETDPAASDTDGDGTNDGDEVRVRGTDPAVRNADARSEAAAADRPASSAGPIVVGSAVVALVSFWLALLTAGAGAIVGAGRFLERRGVGLPSFVVDRSLRRIGLAVGLFVVLALSGTSMLLLSG